MKQKHCHVNVNDFLILLFLFGMIVFENGSIISKIFKIVFVLFSTAFFIFDGLHLSISCHFVWIISIFTLDVLSYFWAFSKSTAIAGIMTVGLNTLCIVYFTFLLNCDKRWKQTTFIGVICFPALRFFRAFLKYGFIVFSGLRNIDGFRDYNTIAMFAAFGAVFAFFENKYIKQFRRSLLFVFINCIIIAISLSRKGIIYLVIPIILLVNSEDINLSKRVKSYLVTIISFFVSYGIIMNSDYLYKMVGKGIQGILRYATTGTGDSSSAARNDRITFGIKMFLDKKWLGYGVQNYNYLFANSGYITDNMVVADNNYIDILVNTGIIGIIVYYGLHFYLLFKYFHLQSKNNYNRLGFAVLITLMICDYGVSSYLYMHSQFFLALASYLIMDRRSSLKDNLN